MSNKKILNFVILIFSGWRVGLFIVTFLGLSIIPNITQPQYNINPPSADLIYWERWANWDGAHFLSIAQYGYEPFQVVFFPLYPLLIKFLSLLTTNYFWAGFIISQIFTVISLYYLYKLVLLDYKKNVAEKAVILLITFPTSFYLGAVYSESSFLALTLSSFYYARKKNYILASILAGLSSVTRIIGICVIVAIGVEYLYQKGIKINLIDLWANRFVRFTTFLTITTIILYFFNSIFIKFQFWEIVGVVSTMLYLLFLVCIICFLLVTLYLILKNKRSRDIFMKEGLQLTVTSLAPFLIYSYYLYYTQGYPHAYVLYESNWGRNISLPWELMFAYLSSLLSNNFFIVSQTEQILIEFIFALVFIIGAIISFVKLRLSYAVFFLLALLIPLSTNTLLSIHRFGIVLFPLFILLANVKNKYFNFVWTITSAMLLGLFAILYINKYWVA